MENNSDKKYECPEGFKECVALEMFSAGCGITLEKTGDSYAILNNQQEFLGQIYCSNPVPCISKHGAEFLEMRRKFEEMKELLK